MPKTKGIFRVGGFLFLYFSGAIGIDTNNLVLSELLLHERTVSPREEMGKKSVIVAKGFNH